MWDSRLHTSTKVDRGKAWLGKGRELRGRDELLTLTWTWQSIGLDFIIFRPFYFSIEFWICSINFIPKDRIGIINSLSSWNLKPQTANEPSDFQRSSSSLNNPVNSNTEQNLNLVQLFLSAFQPNYRTKIRRLWSNYMQIDLNPDLHLSIIQTSQVTDHSNAQEMSINPKKSTKFDKNAWQFKRKAKNNCHWLIFTLALSHSLHFCSFPSLKCSISFLVLNFNVSANFRFI